MSNQALLQADIRARTDALDVKKSFIVQAPAGSGKTELLIQRYLRLLAIVDSPEEILAITFTRKAAAEMQARVANAMRNALNNMAASAEHEKLTLALADDVLERDKKMGWGLIQSPNRLRIETVDAFGAGVARSLPLSSGIGGAGNTIADTEVLSYYRKAAAATLDYLASDENAGETVERVLVHLDNHTSLYIAYVSRMLASREQWLSLIGSGGPNREAASTARQKLEANIAEVVEQQLQSLHILLPSAFTETLQPLLKYCSTNLLEDGVVDNPLTVFAENAEIPAASANEREGWIALANLLLTQKGDWRKRVTRKEGFPLGDTGQKQALYDLIDSVRDKPGLRTSLSRVRLLPEPRYTDEQWNVLLALFDLLPLAVAELHRIFSMQRVTDHNEVALSAARALGSSDAPGDVMLLLDYQIKHLLVDEMQDTSIGQYDILKKLTAGWASNDGRSMFCVGDPMQSIYRFRNAEVGEYLLARQNGIGNVHLEPLHLRRNFRSGENLVHWFNTTFLQVMPLKDDVSVSAISYSESVPIDALSDQGNCCVHALFDAKPSSEAEHTIDVIRDCLNEDSIGDAAVLVRSRTHLSALLPLLRESGLEFQSVEIERLTDLPEMIDLLALTRALCHDADRLAWLAMLRGPWVGLFWKDLHALVRNDRDKTVIELSQVEERCSSLSADGLQRLQHFLAMIRPFTERLGTTSLRDRVERAWYALGGPALLGTEEQLDNVYRFFATIEKIEVAGTLEDVFELERRLDEERVSSLVSSECRLQVMTMHKAKGLEFDHVILPSLGRRIRGQDREVLNWLNTPDDSGNGKLIISPVGPRSELENDALHQFIESVDREKDRMELDRLLYVACTRARRTLHLIGSAPVNSDTEELRPPVNGSLLHRLWPAIEVEFARQLADRKENGRKQAADAEDEDEKTTTLVTPQLRRLKTRWNTPVPPDLPATSSQPERSTANSDREVEFYWVGTAARHAGTIVHRWLQRIADGQTDVNPEDLSAIRSTSKKWADGLGVSKEQLEMVCDRTEAALKGILDDDRGRWILQGAGAAELALTGIVDSRLESVVIDRVRIDDDGTHWIVDYKTSTHEGGDLKGFLRQETDRYRPQLARYATLYANLTDAAVRTALYFPLLQEFCEVSVEG